MMIILSLRIYLWEQEVHINDLCENRKSTEKYNILLSRFHGKHGFCFPLIQQITSCFGEKKRLLSEINFLSKKFVFVVVVTRAVLALKRKTTKSVPPLKRTKKVELQTNFLFNVYLLKWRGFFKVILLLLISHSKTERGNRPYLNTETWDDLRAKSG